MANTNQARKRVLQNEKKRRNNASQRTAVKTKVKNVVKAIRAKGKPEELERLYHDLVRNIDRASGKNLTSKNKAGRYKSRLLKSIRAYRSENEAAKNVSEELPVN